MLSRSDIVTSLISDYEDGKISLEEALSSINENTNQPIDQNDLNNYWRSESLEDFVAKLTYESIADWKNIDDQKALELIEETKLHWENISVRARNCEALEKRYAKTSGYLISIIDQPKEDILSTLKKDNAIYL